MSAVEHEIPVVQPAHPVVQMDVRQVRERAGIKYREEGEGTPILFLHGIGGGAAIFTPQLAHFGRRYRAIAWEMPGHAGSAPLPLVTMAALAAALAGFIEALGLDRPILVGHSLGGMIVLRLLAEAPDLARAIVLSQTSPAFGASDPAWAEAFIAAKLAPLDAGRAMPALAPEAIAQSVGPGADPAGIAAAEACFAATPHSTYRDMVLAMPGFDARATLPTIAVPTLVVAGSLDRSAPAAGCERMAARIPGARYVLLDGAGHLAHAERPAAFNAALDDFLP
ncbi:MAG: alpha/beta fold hydrolase [Acetobacteraceae bacterium]|nr:alpha/beta fold hydrolase [Acetobacteraceae bacterium]